MNTEQKIDELRAKITPLMAELEQLQRQNAVEKSREFIRVNNITRDDVEHNEGEGKPFFQVCWAFGDWLKANSKKRFAVWNDRIYFTSDLIAHRMPDTLANIHELP